MTPFDRLDPALQYQVAYGLGFSELRPVQELTIDAVLDDANVVVLAPTAGGKTEAAFVPLLSRVLTDNWAAPSVLYVTPIKALINNQEARLQHLTGLVGRRAFKWHGDVSAAARKRFLREPADVLLTTPESVEAMLISQRVPTDQLFTNLRAVVIDEIHAFASDDRGAHLACLLERLTRICGRDLQRIGLSATVGNPDEILAWVQGSSQRPQRLIDPPKSGVAAKVELDFVGTLENSALMIEKLHPGRKRLVFCDSRRKVEDLGRSLDERGVRTFVMHSSLSASERALAEREFAEGRDCVIVATSAMELGIDVGDLDHVLQVGSPRTVAAFLQRMGRTGRRPDTTPNCTFLCVEEDELVQAAGLLRLHEQGYVEPAVPVSWGAHLFAHQLLALSLQCHGVPEGDVDAWIGIAPPIAGLSGEDREAILHHMLEEALLFRDNDLFVFGPAGDKRYGGRNFLDLYAIFESTQDFKVFHGRNEVGELSPLWVAQKGQVGSELTLGGKPWLIKAVDHQRRRLDVVRGRQGGSIGWIGQPLALHYDLCRSMYAVLRGEDKPGYWTGRAAAAIEIQRDAFADVPGDDVQRIGGSFVWHTYAGAAANSILAYFVEKHLGIDAKSGNLRIEFPSSVGGRPVVVPETLDAVRQATEQADHVVLESIGSELDPEMLGKFGPCLPRRIQDRQLASNLLDLSAARRLISTTGIG